MFHQGRPDIIVTIRHKESKEIEKIVIGEVNTTDVNCAIRGLEELLDYTHLVKYNEMYAYGRIPVKGVLCVADVGVENDVVEDGLVKVVGG